MKTSMLPIFFLQILVYVIHCAAAPAYPDSPTPTYSTTPTPTPTNYFKLRVWNHPRSTPHFDGYSEMHLGRMSFNITAGYSGFDVYLDTTNVGMLREPPSGFFGALVPTQPPGLYDFVITSRASKPGSLTRGFTFKYLQCGMCSGRYLQYDPSNSDPGSDRTGASFLIVPCPGTGKGSWSIQWNDFSKNPNAPAGSYRVQLLQG